MELDDNCRQCGKPREDAFGIAPVSRGRAQFGPGWSCYECMGVERGECVRCGEETDLTWDDTFLCLSCKNNMAEACPRCNSRGELYDGKTRKEKLDELRAS